MKIRAKYQGEFKNRDNDKTYRVTIQNSDIAQTKYIVDPTEYNFKETKNNVMFDPDPVTITLERDEMIQQILIRQATINLKANFDLSDTFFADTNRSIKVMIEQKVGDNWVSVFNGYVDPLQFKQGAAYNYESFTINATDPLGALEDMKVNQLPTLLQTDIPPIKTIITECINAIGCDIDYTHWTASPNSPNEDISVNMYNFYGDSVDDYMTLKEILETLLRYQGAMMYYNPAIDKVVIQNMYIDADTPVDFDFKHTAMDDSTTMSMSDPYNRVKLKCKIEPIEEEIVEFLDDDYLESDYPSYQKYITEMVSPGDGHSAHDGMQQLINSDAMQEGTDYDNGYVREHFCWIRKDKRFNFGSNGYMNVSPKPLDQSDYLLWMKDENNIGKGILVSYGNTGKITKIDNSARANVDMTNYLQIAVNGHGQKYKKDSNWHLNTILSKFQQNSPICTYSGLASATLTPTEQDITNYILIKGKLLLNPLQQRTGLYPDNRWSTSLKDDIYQKSLSKFTDIISVDPDRWWHHTVPSENKYGDYYTHKCWSCTTPKNPVYSFKRPSVNPMIGNMERNENKDLQYLWSSYGNDVDTISYLPILCCELKVGDKYCCENLNYEKNYGKRYYWLTAEEAAAGVRINNQTVVLDTIFTIGIDPQKEDYIIGQVFDIASNITHEMNLEGEKATAIPITINDQLKGTPELKILYPCNITWDDYNLSSFWTFNWPWLTGPTYVLEMIESIMIQSLKIWTTSDKAKIREGVTTADNDLVYTSNETNIYAEDNESESKVVTPLTMEECLTRGVKYQMSDSYVYHRDSTPFWGFTYNNGSTTVKPEEAWVDYMWLQLNQPRKVLSTNIKDSVLTDEQAYDTDLGYWMTCGTLSGTIGSEDSHFNKGYLTRVEWNLKNRSMDMDIREAADYTPIWD